MMSLKCKCIEEQFCLLISNITGEAAQDADVMVKYAKISTSYIKLGDEKMLKQQKQLNRLVKAQDQS